MLLADHEIREQVEAGRVVIDPYHPDLIQPSSVDVRMDRYFRVFENHRYPHIDPSEEQPDLTRLIQTEGDEPFVLHPGEFVLASTYETVTLPDDLAGRLEGKALAVHTPIPTPDGWRAMGDLRVGDEVFDETGTPCRVVAATEAMLGRPCREVVFSDGQSIVCDASHQWLTRSEPERKHGKPPCVRTTAEIERTLWARNERNHHIALPGPVRYPPQDLPTDPYVLGSRLGDNTDAATKIPVAGNEYIPEPYLRGSVEQRLALLQGLMDSDGHVDDRGRCELVTTREPLADAVLELAASLGERPVKHKRRVTLNGVDQGPGYQVRFTPALPVFQLQRKLDRLRVERLHRFRAIAEVRQVETQPVRCIQVSSPNGLFLAGPAYIPTHNSSLGRLGLLTHSTAGWVDPGFTGHVTLELSNVATLPIKLWPGMKIGQLCLFRLSQPAEHPYGSAVYGSRYQGQRGPTPSRAYLNFHRTQI